MIILYCTSLDSASLLYDALSLEWFVCAAVSCLAILQWGGVRGGDATGGGVLCLSRGVDHFSPSPLLVRLLARLLARSFLRFSDGMPCVVPNRESPPWGDPKYGHFRTNDFRTYDSRVSISSRKENIQSRL